MLAIFYYLPDRIRTYGLKSRSLGHYPAVLQEESLVKYITKIKKCKQNCKKYLILYILYDTIEPRDYIHIQLFKVDY